MRISKLIRKIREERTPKQRRDLERSYKHRCEFLERLKQKVRDKRDQLHKKVPTVTTGTQTEQIATV